MIRIVFYIALGAVLMMLWQDPSGTFIKLENFYDATKVMVIDGIQRLKSGS